MSADPLENAPDPAQEEADTTGPSVESVEPTARHDGGADKEKQDSSPDEVPLSRRIKAEERQRRLRAESLETLYGEETRSVAGRDWIGDSAYRVSGGGTVYRADTIYVGAPGRRSGARLIRLQPDRASRLLGCLVVTSSQERLVKTLNDEPVVFLAGKVESGWKTTAIAALLAWAGASGKEDQVPVAQLSLATGTTTPAETDLEAGLGYLVDASSSPWVRDPDQTIARLRELAMTRSCRMVVLVTGEHRVTGIVEHLPPPAEEVFRRTLAYCLDDVDVWRTHDFHQHATTVAELVVDCRPAEAAQIAEQVAEGLRQGRSVSDVLQNQPRFTLERLRNRLDDGTSMLSRCFLMSSAVLHGLPEVTVSRATLDLADLVRAKEDRKDEEGIPVWEQLKSWTDYGGLSARPSGQGDGQRIELRRGLAPAVLRLVWEELPVIRSPLYTWLKALGESEDWEVPLKAAHAVGRLATCDFQEIDREFLDPWSRDRRLLPKMLAAWAMEAAIRDPHMADKVHGRLQSWATSELAGQRLTAALAYGSQIGVDNIEEALRAFQRITLTAVASRLCDAVARSVADVYTTETADRIVTELARWTGTDNSPGQQLTAALALVRLLSLREHNPQRPSPIDHPHGSELARLWLNALVWGLSSGPPAGSQRSFTPEAWDLLAGWAALSVDHPALRETTETIFAEAARSPRLRRACLLHLTLWKIRCRVSPEFCDHLTRLTKGN